MPAIVDLCCEYLTNPLGLDELEPRLTWRLDSDEPGAEQLAYGIAVGSANGLSDFWDIGRIEAKAHPNVAYGGSPIPSATKVFWRVTVWDQAGRELHSEEATWETGLLELADWKAKWIQGPLAGGPRTTVPAAYLRRSFRLSKPVASARLYITALGLYVAEINGKRVGDHHLSPGWTHYHKRLRYPIVVHTDLPQTGTFECSDPLINKLQANILWGWRGNSVDVPTDCPQRDERLGWAGDAQVFAPTACFNTFALTFFEKYMQDMADAQHEDGSIPPVAPDVDLNMPDGGPAWADAFVRIPMVIWHAYGDTRMIKRYYPAMKRWLEQQERTSKDGIRCYEEYEGFKGFGDWLNIDAETPKDWIATAYFLDAVGHMIGYARLLGLEEDHERFAELHSLILLARKKLFVNGIDGLSQTSLLLFEAYFNNPIPADRNALLVADIEARKVHLSTGFVGAHLILDALTEAGRLDLAYRLLEQKTWPSWLYPVTQGATTIWERWDGWTEDKGFQDPGMNSFNHYAYGAVGSWLYKTVAGIELVNQFGWPDVVFRATPGGSLTWARAAIDTLQGRIESSWRIENQRFLWSVVIPPNMTASIYFPEGATDLPEGYDQRGCGLAPVRPGTHSFDLGWL